MLQRIPQNVDSHRDASIVILVNIYNYKIKKLYDISNLYVDNNLKQ